MNSRVKIALLLVGSLAVLWLVYTRVIGAMYLEPRRALLMQIQSAQSTLATYRDNQSQHGTVKRDLQQYINRTLGGSLETVDHQFRSRLNRLCEQVGFEAKSYSVATTGAVKVRETPARSRFSGAANRSLRDEPDFNELEGTLTASGTLEQALELIERVDAEPWLKRIDHLRLTPRDNGSRFDVHIRLTTLFLPRGVPDAAAHLTARPADIQRIATLAQRNPFRVPPAPTQKPTAQPEATPAFAYADWQITGIAQTHAGLEIWLRNTQTNQTRRMTPGETLHEATLTAVHADAAEFRLDDQRFTIAIGQKLSDRTPITQ